LGKVFIFIFSYFLLNKSFFIIVGASNNNMAHFFQVFWMVLWVSFKWFLEWFYWLCYNSLGLFHFGWFKMVSTWGLVEHIQLWPLLYLLITLELYKQKKKNYYFATFCKCQILHTWQPSYFQQRQIWIASIFNGLFIIILAPINK